MWSVARGARQDARAVDASAAQCRIANAEEMFHLLSELRTVSHRIRRAARTGIQCAARMYRYNVLLDLLLLSFTSPLRSAGGDQRMTT